MTYKSGPDRERKQYWLNLTLAGAAGQAGCVTLIIVIAAVFAGLWLDARFNSQPAFTLFLLVGSIPISLIAMLFIVRLFTAKIKAGPPPAKALLETSQDTLPGEAPEQQ